MERREIRVSGTVQGVGFRPFVHALANRLALRGMVQNRVGDVAIEVEGEEQPLDEFVRLLMRQAPPLARIDDISCKRTALRGEKDFRIEMSAAGEEGPIVVGPDAAICDECLSELFDPENRRFGYPFINCTNCGPRLTIVTGSPYDRHRSTMARFPLCAACRADYENPSDRRFHAEAIACEKCGPRLILFDGAGRRVECGAEMAVVADALREGKICAIKGIGGYHLACDATNRAAVNELRRRKHRDEKPFAVMVADIQTAERVCEISPAESRLLTARQRPIVLLKKRLGGGLAESLAPGNPMLGLMLPYTPVHHLLLRELGAGALVMTSGNRSDEPIAVDEADALSRLRGIADYFLANDRDIHVRCDDSVTRVIGGVESPIRRSRGCAPDPVRLGFDCPEPILAVGGQLKVTFALGRDSQVILSHHVGDLDHYQNLRAFEKDVELYERLFYFQPRVLAHDLHPDYGSTRYAIRRSGESGLGCVAVQHHHAHMASCMVENRLAQRVIGVIFDGTGFGTDGAIWGGEFLVGDCGAFRRAGHLRYVGMPGGAQAIHEPWRMAAAHLWDAGVESPNFDHRIEGEVLRIVRVMLGRQFNAPQTSSAGRLFDAVASLAGIRDRVSFEGQAAMQLEWAASTVEDEGTYAYDVSSAADATGEECLSVDTRPMIRGIAADLCGGAAARVIARRFHNSMVAMIGDVCRRVRESTGIETVVLSGGVFMNALLSVESERRLACDGFRVFRHQRVPPNDGGLSLGQVAVAASQMQRS